MDAAKSNFILGKFLETQPLMKNTKFDFVRRNISCFFLLLWLILSSPSQLLVLHVCVFTTNLRHCRLQEPHSRGSEFRQWSLCLYVAELNDVENFFSSSR